MRSPTLNRPLAGYLLVASYLSCAGWFLSIFRALTPFSLGMTIAVGLVAAAIWCRRSRSVFQFRFLPHRWRRLFPALYLVVAGLVFLSGALYPASFGDAVSYRIPRCLQWLSEGGWYWIPTFDNRQNNRGCVFEWMSLPVLALLRTDRFVFLINYSAFLLLPSLLFQMLRQLGISGRTAWAWMWIWPTGMGFITQSTDSANDFLGGFFVLAALNFGLLYSRAQREIFLYLSVFAFSLATGVKAINLLLAPPWLIALAPGLWRRVPAPVPVGIILIIALFSSFLPNALFNWRVSGDILATSFEPNVFKPPMSPILRGLVSGVMMIVQNFYPAYIPIAESINRDITSYFLKTGPGAYLESHFETGLFWIPGNYARIDVSGLGFFLSLLVAVSFGYTLWRRSWTLPWLDWRYYIPFTCLLSLLFFLCQSSLSQVGRLALPYYTLLLPLLLYSAVQFDLLRRGWWRVLAALPMVGAILFLLTWPVRPVLPMAAILGFAEKTAGPSYLLNFADSMYDQGLWVESGADWINQALPSRLRRVGLIRHWNQAEESIWRPFGFRRVVVLTQTETPESIQRKGLSYIVASQSGISDYFGTSPEGWAKEFNGRVTSQCKFGNENWYVIVLSSYVPPTTL